jgi:hypothetical protein
MIAKNFFEDDGLDVQIDVASEYRYRNIKYNKNTLVILISQSGETADTIAAMRKANDKKIDTLAIVNVDGSTIARECTYKVLIEAGKEIAVVLVHSDKKRSSFTVSELLNIEDIEDYRRAYLVPNEQIGDCEMEGKPFPIRMPAMEKVVLIVVTPYWYNFVETPQKGMFFKAKDGDEDIIAFNSDGDFDNEGFWENNEYDGISHLGEYSSVEECQSRASALQRIVDQLEIILKGNLGDEDED